MISHKTLPMPKSGLKKRKKNPIGITLHHSATKDGNVLYDAESFLKYHVETNGWTTIGYGYIIERCDGEVTIVHGRPDDTIGAHCPELNNTHIGICIAGNFDLAPPDYELLDAAVVLCQELIKKYNMDINTAITYHCDYSEKSCPGKKFPKQAFILAVRGEERP